MKLRRAKTPTPIFVLISAVWMLGPGRATAENAAISTDPQSTINVTDFGVKPDTGEDSTFGVYLALQACHAVKNPVLIFPKGTYQFYPERAGERYYSISNNWHKMQRVALPLWNFDNITVDGQGSDFIMHGLILPVVLDGTKHGTIENISIDWQRPSLSQGEVIESDETHFDLRISDEYPYKIVNGQLIFTEATIEYPLRSFLEFDPQTKATAFQVKDGGLPAKVEALGPGVIRLTFKHLRTIPKKGNVIVLRGGLHRETPAIFCTNSQNILSQNVNIYTASGMGFIAQRCDNITLNNTNVRVRDGSTRLFTCDADATHFVDCSGQILLENCLFENQLDDACNTHGIYSRIEQKLDDHTLLIRLVHPEQVGVEVAASGEHIRFVDNQTYQGYATATVRRVKWVNTDYFLLTVAESIPAQVKADNVFENMDRQPDLIIRNCTTRGNRARGFLLNTAGKILVENNTMEEPGICLLIGADAFHWFESGPVKNVTIRNNQFIDPNYGVWGTTAIDFNGHFRGAGTFERNITIENNLFKLFNIAVFSGNAISGLHFHNNTLERTTTYPQTQKPPLAAVDILNCHDVDISDNICRGIPEVERQISIDGKISGELGEGQVVVK